MLSELRSFISNYYVSWHLHTHRPNIFSRFTVPMELNQHNETQIGREADSDCESDGVKDETLSPFPPMNSELLRYLFHQRRHQFLKVYDDVYHEFRT